MKYFIIFWEALKSKIKKKKRKRKKESDTQGKRKKRKLGTAVATADNFVLNPSDAPDSVDKFLEVFS